MQKTGDDLVLIIIVTEGLAHSLIVSLAPVIPASVFLSNGNFGIQPLLEIKVAPAVIPRIVFNQRSGGVIFIKAKLLGMLGVHSGNCPP